ncbi:MAG: ABC transporter ATP-binding protein [Candidatus Krumholzibacteriota bacterium]|nr:ABC transporter ATP-binding protein [Candidatus Krumholzibacteriota bacterium]
MRTVEFHEITMAYRKGEPVLDGVGFAADGGDVIGLLGRNGAGKTTLLRIAMGMLAPQAGAVRLFGLDPREHPLAVKQRVGYVSEDQILPEFLKVAEVIAMHRQLFPSWDETLERRLCERFAVPPGARIRTLSKGQARQVALLCAVAHRPELLVLDEPAGGLDPAVRREFLETAIQLLNEEGTTILFSSHHMTDVERMAGRVVLLHDAAVLLDNPLDELREGFSLALVPVAAVDGERLRAMPGCLGLREQGGAWRAIVREGPAACRERLAAELGVAEARCQSLPLEEMFIELVGGRS